METRVLVSTTRILTDCHRFLKGSMETAECGEKFHEALELMLQYEGSYLTLTHPVTNPKSLQPSLQRVDAMGVGRIEIYHGSRQMYVDRQANELLHRELIYHKEIPVHKYRTAKRGVYHH